MSGRAADEVDEAPPLEPEPSLPGAVQPERRRSRACSGRLSPSVPSRSSCTRSIGSLQSESGSRFVLAHCVWFVGNQLWLRRRRGDDGEENTRSGNNTELHDEMR